MIDTDNRPHAAIKDGRVYGYGDTKDAAWQDFKRQIAGASRSMQLWMRDRIVMVPLSDEDASEVAELVNAPAICWL